MKIREGLIPILLLIGFVVTMAMAPPTFPGAEVKDNTYTALATKRAKDVPFYPVCRHDAIYWGSVVIETHPVRIMFGRVYKEDNTFTWHVQPQFQTDDEKWHYFTILDNTVWHVKMPKSWVVDYSMSLKDYGDWLLDTDWIYPFQIDLVPPPPIKLERR